MSVLNPSHWPTLTERDEVLVGLRTEWLRVYRDRRAPIPLQGYTRPSAPKSTLPTDFYRHRRMRLVTMIRRVPEAADVDAHSRYRFRAQVKDLAANYTWHRHILRSAAFTESLARFMDWWKVRRAITIANEQARMTQ